MDPIRRVIVGAQWGDEGKGKIVDEAIDEAKSYDDGKRILNLRFQGGPNAGHTLFVRNDGDHLTRFVTHSAPSGLASNVDVAIGPNVAFDPEKFVDELEQAVNLFDYSGRILISERVGLLLDYHRKIDAWRESNGGRKIGTTKSGIGPFYQDNAQRRTRITFQDYISDNFPDKLREVFKMKGGGLCSAIEGNITNYCNQLLDLHEPIRKKLAPFTENLEYRLQEYIENNDHIVIEGAQGTELDVSMGTIPDVTSSHLLAPYAFPDLGISRRNFKIHLVEKIYPTRVGEGNMPTLANNNFGELVANNAGEMGATTGRKRRVGYPDWVRIRRAVMLNDADGIYLTRADCVQDHDLKVGIGYVVNGEITNEAPFDDSRIESVVYGDKIFNWNLWAGTRDVSNPELVDDKLRVYRKAYVNAGFNSLPEDLKKFVELHDNYVGVPTVGISIGPSRGETVLRNISLD